MSDNGIGITAEALPRIFDLFTQAQSKAERSEGGLGIGLALVRRLSRDARRIGVGPQRRTGLRDRGDGAAAGPGVARPRPVDAGSSRAAAAGGAAADPRRRRQPRRRELAGAAAAAGRTRRADGVRRRRGAGRRPTPSSPRSCCSTSACRSSTASKRRARCGAGRGGRGDAGGPHRLGAAAGSAAHRRGRVRRAPGQAGVGRATCSRQSAARCPVRVASPMARRRPAERRQALAAVTGRVSARSHRRGNRELVAVSVTAWCGLRSGVGRSFSSASLRL